MSDFSSGISELRQEYWTEIRSICDEAKAEVISGEIADEDALNDWLHEHIDGHEFVIYTFKNHIVLLVSGNDGAYVEELGAEGLVDKHGCLNWAGMAYMAMLADVRETIDSWDDMVAEKEAAEEAKAETEAEN